MYKFGEKHPIGFEIILIIISFLAAGIIVAAGSATNMDADLSASIGRIIVAAALFLIYQRAFKGAQSQSTANPVIIIPALLFAAWNIFYNLSSGMTFGGISILAKALITALAPALFEEMLFRGIFIYNLKKKGHSDLVCLWISSILFAAIHLTNLAGSSPTAVALQTGYSLVIGMALAALYLRNNSITQVIAAHFLIDFTNRIYVETPTSTSTVQLAIFAVLLVAEFVYAVKLTKDGSKAQE